jgi:hypothetical protein
MTLHMLLVRPNIFMDSSVYLVFDLQWSLVWTKIEVSSLAPEHVIKPGELRFRIGLPMDWQSSIERLCSDQVDQLHF